jgi:hypothetical protein
MVDPSQRQVVVTGGDGPGEIGDLTVRFVVADPVALGGERNVTMGDATSARVSYVRDGKFVADQEVSVGEAVTLIGQASRDAQATATRTEPARSPRRAPADVACLVCGGSSFEEHVGPAWTGGPVGRFLVCRSCGFVLQFARPPG